MIRSIGIKKEKKSFDKQAELRQGHGFVPDLRRLRKVNWFYNNVWRDPEYVKIHWLPKVKFVIDIAKKRGGRVIELGCGTGYLSLELARNGLDVLGVDVSAKSIEIANKYYKLNTFKRGFGKLRYMCRDFSALEFDGMQFDTAIFFRSLHHVEDIDSLLCKISVALKNKGNLIICEPIRGNFSMQSAEMAAILRAVSPTWIAYKNKLSNLCNKKQWNKYVKDIYKEYTYQDEFKQSSMDNKTDSARKIIIAVGKFFTIKKTLYSDAFIDKLIGGLRGRDRYNLARFLKLLDNLLVSRNALPPMELTIHAIKKYFF